MKILKPGDVSKLDDTRRFECNKCGCVFEATKAEYRGQSLSDDEWIYACECPVCKYTVTMSGE